MIRNVFRWWGFQSLDPEILVCSVGNCAPIAIEMHPLGSVVHTHYPKEGLYRVTRHEPISGSYTNVYGVLVIETRWGYPETINQGILICQILNGERKFERREDGRWGVSA